MNDLCRCTGGDCPLRVNCLRFTAEVYGRQDFFTAVPYSATLYTCDYFVDDRPSHEAIEKLAYSLWENAGCPQGRALEHWFQAEQTLLEQNRGKR